MREERKAKASVPTPHIAALPGDIAETVLLPGDPLRAKRLAENFLEEVHGFNEVRNMFGFTGVYRGQRVSVMGTGMGCPSMGIYAHELIHFYGAKRLIRIGTAGAMQESIAVRDLVLAEGASTNSNFPALFELPGTFAPLADFELLYRAARIASAANKRVSVGAVLTSDMFYGPAESEAAVEKWSKMGVLAVEMETAALYATAASLGAKALSVLTVSDHLLTGETLSAEEREAGFTDMAELALSLATEEMQGGIL